LKDTYLHIARPDASRADIDKAIDSRSGPVFAQEMLSSRIGEQRRALQEVQGRHEELRKMEKSIEELAQLFQDMQLLLEV
jgi:syntaxin 1B/2/3